MDLKKYQKEVSQFFKRLNWSDYNIHIITGPNGMCMCGEGGLTCQEILMERNKKAAPVQQTTNGNPVPSDGKKENGEPSAVTQICPKCRGYGEFTTPGSDAMIDCEHCGGTGKLRVA